MSLNRCEEALLAYLRAHRDEERHWRARVLEIDRGGGPREAQAAKLERELRTYAAERSGTDASLRESLGGGQVRLRNLVEWALATWTPTRPTPKRKP